jgi:hypothetical protein
MPGRLYSAEKVGCTLLADRRCKGDRLGWLYIYSCKYAARYAVSSGVDKVTVTSLPCYVTYYFSSIIIVELHLIKE